MSNKLTKISPAMIDPGTAGTGDLMQVAAPGQMAVVAPESVGDPLLKSFSIDSNSGTITIVDMNDNIYSASGLLTERTAPEGKTGARGPRGLAGAAGRNGRDGRPGIQGCPGIKGDRGTIGPTGPTGPIGPQGLLGPIGPTGPTGATGAPGNDGDEPEWVKGTRGVAMRLRRAGGMIQSGRFTSETLPISDTVSLLFPLNFVNAIANIQITFIDPECYQASKYFFGEYIYDDAEIGGITITLKPGTHPNPLPDKWDFFWQVMGD
ncbi:MAG: collagen-like protein [Pararheinheimera sp.]|nr:collagen-like protein [Rheinheimera sp.]